MRCARWVFGTALVFVFLVVPVTVRSGTAPTSTEALTLGKQVFATQCAACHGAEGGGDGEAAYLLYPRPRNFHAGKFRLVSTWEGIPTDDDLFQTISRGMPGSAMPAWEHLPEETRWALVAYVKSLVEAPLEVKPAKPPASAGRAGAGIIAVSPEPPYDEHAKARAAELFRDGCASCHGATAHGDGVASQTDDTGLPIRARDLTTGVFKGNPDPESLYRRIIAGMPGSPMPTSETTYGEDAWHLVHFVRSLSSDTQRARAEMHRFTIPVTRVESLPDHPDAGV